ncbi:hypothetical protein BD408DRAFT_338127, partial [Parasitella parasitica]
TVNMQLEATSTLWTTHCGIISFNPLLTLHYLNTDLDDRIIACTVVHANALFPPIALVNIYAPANYAIRNRFYQQLLTLPIFSFPAPQPTFQHDSATVATTSDFNYHHCWHQLLMNHFFECTHSREEGPLLPTFRRGNCQSTIDYFFASPVLQQHLHSSDIQFMASEWTDHAMFRTRFVFHSDQQGPGLWRANPHLNTNQYFVDTLFTELDSFFTNLSLESIVNTNAFIPISTPQENWDDLKTLVKHVAQKIGRHKCSWRARLIKRLQNKRKRLLKQQIPPHDSNDLLQAIEEQLSLLQTKAAQDQALRAGKHWR